VTRWETERIARAGIAYVVEGRGVLAELTVKENLLLGAYHQTGNLQAELARVYELFPRLAERQRQEAGTMSGGEQQMLAIGRALMSRPKLMLLDEPSLGLAPLLIEEIFRVIREINRTGTGILLVEQNAAQAIRIADYGYVLEAGRLVLEGSASDLQANDNVQQLYLGISTGAAGRPPVKRRRRRWS